MHLAMRAACASGIAATNAFPQCISAMHVRTYALTKTYSPNLSSYVPYRAQGVERND